MRSDVDVFVTGLVAMDLNKGVLLEDAMEVRGIVEADGLRRDRPKSILLGAEDLGAVRAGSERVRGMEAGLVLDMD